MRVPLPRTRTAWVAAAASALTLAAALGQARCAPARGLRAAVHLRPGLAGPPAVRRVVPAPDLDLMGRDRTLPLSFFSARFSGFWLLPRSAAYDLHLRATGAAVLRLDGRVILTHRRDARSRGFVTTVPLEAGLHALEIDYDPYEGPPALKVLWAAEGGAPRALDADALFPEPPSAAALAGERVFGVAGVLAVLAWAGLGCALVLRHPRAWAGRARHAAHRLRGPALAVSVAALTAYAAALRFEALVARYWYDGAPALAERARSGIRELRPAGLVWLPEVDRYGADPFAYLRFARERAGFYDAHVREPVHLAATRLFLFLLDGRDIGVSFASASLSALTVAGTYLLGAAVASPAVGLAAAFSLAVERQVIGHSVEGWRDETFACFAVLAAWALLRLRAHPCFRHAVWAGGAAGLACLTRLTALSFVLPGFALAAWGAPPRAARAGWAALGLGLAAALVMPYLLTCAVAFGDPLFAVNYHTAFYRARSNLDPAADMSWSEYLAPQRHPFRLLDTMLVGLTAYPFANKWAGFDYWSDRLGAVLSTAALAGLALLLLSPGGRLFVAVLVTSLLPFAFTWEVRGGSEWRFTLHAYPFYLVAAWTALFAVLGALRSPWWLVDRIRTAAARPRRLAAAAAALVLAVALLWTAAGALKWLRVGEELRQGRVALVEVGPRDWPFVGEGWRGPTALGSLRVRCSRGPASVLRLPLQAGRDYLLALRLAPFSYDGALPQAAGVRLNGRILPDLVLPRDPQWALLPTLRLPAEAVREGLNHIELRPRYTTSPRQVGGGDQGLQSEGDTALLLRFLRVGPAPPPGGPMDQPR